MPAKEKTKTRHAYVRLYPSDWLAGVSYLPPTAEWVYLQICLFNWDKAEPMPKMEARLRLGRLATWEDDLEMLIAADKVVRDRKGNLMVRRAMAEARRSMSHIDASSRGGKKTALKKINKKQATGQGGTVGGKRQPEPEPEPEPDKERGLSSSQGDALAYLLRIWLDVAKRINERHGRKVLAEQVKATDSRRTKLRARLKEHSVEDIASAIKQIEHRPFLLGNNERKWTADFNWLLRTESVSNILEGQMYKSKGASGGWNW